MSIDESAGSGQTGEGGDGDDTSGSGDTDTDSESDGSGASDSGTDSSGGSDAGDGDTGSSGSESGMDSGSSGSDTGGDRGSSSASADFEAAVTEALLALSALDGDDLFIIQTDATGDQDLCLESDAIGADIGGIVVGQRGDMVTGFVAMTQPPAESLEDFSWAVIFQVGFASGENRMFVKQIHAGEPLEGEQDSSSNLVEGSAVDISQLIGGLFFNFPIDPNDRPLYASAWGYNLRTEDDNIGCDEAHGAASSLPASPSDTTGGCEAGDMVLCLNDRFQVEVDWTDSDGSGSGTVVPGGADSGYFWFFD